MAKKPSVATVASGYYSSATLTVNFNQIANAFENTLSLDGSGPNAMNADLDMNGNDILNISALYLNGHYITAIDATVDWINSTYNQGSTGSTDRSVYSRLQDNATIKDFGGVGDGVVDNVQAIEDIAAAGYPVSFTKGTWASSTPITPKETWFEGGPDTNLNFAFSGPMVKGNRFTWGGDYEGTLGKLNHPAPNTSHGYENALGVFRGTNTNPDSTPLLGRTAAFIEMHSASNQSTMGPTSNYGAANLLPALTVEHKVHPGTECSPAGISGRVVAMSPPTNHARSMKNLTGVTGVAQGNAGAGLDNYNLWGGNFVVSALDGNAPDVIAGIEVDIIHRQSAPAGFPGGPGSSFGYWAVSGAENGYTSAAFFANSSPFSGTKGWNYLLVSRDRFREWGVYVKNTHTAGNVGSGGYFETAASNSTALQASTVGYNTLSGNGPLVFVAEAKCSGVTQNQFVVTSNEANPVQIRVGSTLKIIQEGAADSGGTGFRMLRVVN